MKLVASVGAAALISLGAAQAGSLEDPIIEGEPVIDEELIIEETTDASQDWLVPAIFLILGGAVVLN